MMDAATDDVEMEPSMDARSSDDDLVRLVRKGALAVALIVLTVALFFSFFSISAAIRTWFQDRWVPVARSAFGVAVAGLAIFVVVRLTRR